MTDKTLQLSPRVAERLDKERIAWLATMRKDGQPQTSPVWFLWHKGQMLIYSQPGAGKLRNIANSPRVEVHFNHGTDGNDVAILEGVATVLPEDWTDVAIDSFSQKYRSGMEGMDWWPPEKFYAEYSVPILVELNRVRSW